MNQHPQIIIIAGPNGAGKSTLAPLLLRDRLGLMEFVNADTIAQGLSAFAPESVAIEAGRVMLKRMRDLTARRKSFAFETTLATRSYAQWLKQMKTEGWETDLVFLWLCRPEIAIERVKERVSAGGHDIPEETIRRRYQAGIRNFFRLYQPVVKSWSVYDHSITNKPGLMALKEGDKKAVIFDDKLWQEFCEVAK